MSKKDLLHRKAEELRAKGLSYSEIRKEVKVAKSTLSLWLKSIPLSPKHKKRLYTKQIQILSKGSQSQKERRAREVEQIIMQAENEIQFPLSRETFRLMGAALYWAEGGKKRMLEMTNSDPFLISFFVKWMKEVFNIPPEKLKARLNIYPQQSEIEIKNFWSELTHIPTDHFGKTYIKPLSTGYKKNNLYYGTIRIEVPKSVNMRICIFGWITATLKEIKAETNFIHRKWERLTKVARPVNLE